MNIHSTKTCGSLLYTKYRSIVLIWIVQLAKHDSTQYATVFIWIIYNVHMWFSKWALMWPPQGPHTVRGLCSLPYSSLDYLLPIWLKECVLYINMMQHRDKTSKNRINVVNNAIGALAPVTPHQSELDSWCLPWWFLSFPPQTAASWPWSHYREAPVSENKKQRNSIGDWNQQDMTSSVLRSARVKRAKQCALKKCMFSLKNHFMLLISLHFIEGYETKHFNQSKTSLHLSCHKQCTHWITCLSKTLISFFQTMLYSERYWEMTYRVNTAALLFIIFVHAWSTK